MDNRRFIVGSLILLIATVIAMGVFAIIQNRADTEAIAREKQRVEDNREKARYKEEHKNDLTYLIQVRGYFPSGSRKIERGFRSDLFRCSNAESSETSCHIMVNRTMVNRDGIYSRSVSEIQTCKSLPQKECIVSAEWEPISGASYYEIRVEDGYEQLYGPIYDTSYNFTVPAPQEL